VELRAERRGGAVRVEIRNRKRRGLRIASEAARDAGGSLRVEEKDDGVVAALELPADSQRAA
jgi:hypothetical protein